MSAPDPYQTPSQASHALPAISKESAKEILFSFKGRIPRRVYWLWGLAVGIGLGIIIGILGAILGPSVDPTTGAPSGGGLFFLLAGLLYIPMIWVGLALGVKRWHDRGKSGWWVLIALVPIVGPIWSFVECGCLRGTVGPNQYGNDPT
ncbi:DUF805 domain-containing protein [Luteolibacter sp. GHJ8]|jgi:uncharacterized membrane protein YhaH (DUF805 family)|uniref:DUF805 domain-containing protein n=1 Tax=Luteolibacter rhizosphaerae TaxID=2989719 RepID=A0ABT3G225_9BACT|nr:DUF805 domain-containing protein [Luteolibacter rhizosphaerae]MCW1913878.1 DUF805 domain-containing protein [Luteolibacter rhizosphaerae]